MQDHDDQLASDLQHQAHRTPAEDIPPECAVEDQGSSLSDALSGNTMVMVKRGINRCLEVLQRITRMLQRADAQLDGESEYWALPPFPTSQAPLQHSVKVMHLTETGLNCCTGDLRKIIRLLDEDIQQRDDLQQSFRSMQDVLQQSRLALLASQAGQESAQYIAEHDQLTGLPNRKALDLYADAALIQHHQEQRLLALMYIDLDGFKAVNDQHGHAVGDELLKIVGLRLSRVVRTEDLISRHGGDEFICVLQNVTDHLAVAIVAKKLFKAISAPCKVGKLSLAIKPSIGIAIYPEDGNSIKVLLEHADQAMFLAKRTRCGIAFHNKKDDKI
ncbi:GGDEF domain-containing protein [Pokkaliibacter plantistimulans]|uniref:GGDEF domain-containing protein n=1 Tax=Pokkaliibacter plantistimulans TaxID=1635171 RepID=UPI000D749FF2|nr:GGDEF domain-containing protein [Pokkaliibacter plantistimulans]